MCWGPWMCSGQGSVPAPLLGPEVGSQAQESSTQVTREGGCRAARRGKLRAQPPWDLQASSPGPPSAPTRGEGSEG